MANPSVQQDRFGDWPLGFLKVTTPGTPVGVMSLVDSNSYNAPGTSTPDKAPSPGGALNPSSASNEFTVNFNQILFAGYKPGASHGMQRNTGNVYLMRKGFGGDGSRDDTGSMVAVIEPGQTFALGAAASNVNVFNGYRYFIDADNANDGALILGLVQ